MQFGSVQTLLMGPALDVWIGGCEMGGVWQLVSASSTAVAGWADVFRYRFIHLLFPQCSGFKRLKYLL